MGQRILITGASGGFGFLTCQSLIERGHQVAGTMRTTTGRNAEVAGKLQEMGVHLVELDVTNEESVNAGATKALEVLGGLDVVIHNAGIGVFGMQEHFTAEDMQKVFDVNVFGVQRLTRALLPTFREQGNGTLMFVSSLLGRMTLPFYGVYNASKWALEALAENYRTELSGFGVESLLIEPGGYPTAFMENLVMPSDNSRVEAYGDFMKAPQAMGEAFGAALAQNTEQRPEKVAEAIADVLDVEYGERPFRTVVDAMGMGDPIKPYNEQLEQLTHGIYKAFGTDGMLKVKK